VTDFREGKLGMTMIERVARAIAETEGFAWDSEEQDEVNRALARALARVAIAAMEPKWQPIDTAPKDGTDIIVYRPKFDGPYIPEVGTDYWHERLNCWGNSRSNTPPTHWQPFPKPVAEELKERQ
jgi:hypothetical protein